MKCSRKPIISNQLLSNNFSINVEYCTFYEPSPCVLDPMDIILVVLLVFEDGSLRHM